MYTEIIDRYRNSDLDDAGMLAFQEDLKVNRELAREFQLEKDIDDALKDAETIDFLSKVINAQKEYKRLHKGLGVVVQMGKKYWYAAASILVLILVTGSILLLGPSQYSNEKLFSMYYNSGESVGIARSGNGLVVEAIMMYHEKDYGNACQLFTDILIEDPDNVAIQYYCGISNIEIKNYDKAITLFNNIISENNNLYIEYAQWYLGLTYLIDGETNRAKEIFSEIASEDGHYYQDESKSILEKINKQNKKKNILNKMLFFVLPF